MIEMQHTVRGLARFSDDPDPPDVSHPDTVVVGTDVAFDDDTVVAAAVSIAGGDILERVCTRSPKSFPYIPGLLAFREAGPILDALAALSRPADLLFCDGNGRIHPREAGLATHLGVALDVPTVGVAKNLLCGELYDPPDSPYPAGTRVPIVADDSVEAPEGTTIGYAVQTRQWEGRDHGINPVYVSAGHRVSAETAADLVTACCAGYKLPEPVRLADAYAGKHA